MYIMESKDEFVFIDCFFHPILFVICKVNTLKNILAVGEKEKAVLQKELDKEKEIQKGYKHNVEIWKKSRLKVE